MCSVELQVFLILAVAVSLACCSSYPELIEIKYNVTVPENTPIDTIIGYVTAKDDDGPKPLHFSIPTPSAQYIAIKNRRGNNTAGVTVDFVLVKQLDRDYTGMSQIKFILNIEDNFGAVGNLVQQEFTIYITDVNDERPVFSNQRYQAEVNESVPVGTNVIKVEATDPDSGLGSALTYNMTPSSLNAPDDYKNAFHIDPVTGWVTVKTELDFDDLYNYYEFIVSATDGYGLASDPPASLLIKIRDVQDKPPYFTQIPYQVNVPENISLGSSVIQVSALDGDKEKGVSNQVTYSWLAGDHTKFNLNSQTGWITVVSNLDRDADDVKVKGGVYTMVVKAQEVDQIQPIAKITATATVTIVVDDINDNSPQFNSQTYEATILENMQEGVPITFTTPVTSMTAKDDDQGENSHFEILLEKGGKPYQDFYPLPKEVFSEAAILIRVYNSSALDYEKEQSVTFQVIAREKNTVEKRSAVATLTVNIIDINDNYPVFDLPSYPIQNVTEDSRHGTVVVRLTATDKDVGNNGKIEYFLRGTSGKFEVNKDTGVVSVSGSLDRETVDTYYMTAEARDGGGYTTFTNLQISILDVNDNPPVFRRDEYFATVKENSLHFLREPVVVQATDDDEPGTNNSHVMYRIGQASSGLENKFQIDPDSGEITLKSEIDYESLPSSLDGRVIVTIVAYDLGDPSKSASVDVTVQVEDVNDNPPHFNASEYYATIPENAGEGTSVVEVFASDDDQTKPNNEFLYRIDGGAGDKFRINFQTGVISVENGAKLDREEKDTYILNVSATDRGAISLDGKCKVIITILDVNDESPTFIPTSVIGNVTEDPITQNTGTVVVTVNATDKDLNADLTYSLIRENIEAYNGEGKKINATEVQDYFGVEKQSGKVYVKSQLDREKAETVILEILVTDDNASGSKEQTATGTVTIIIQDVNDNPPKFQQDGGYSIRVSEGLDAGSEVLRVEAVDTDKNQIVTYEMDHDPSENFTIDTVNGIGILRLRHKLDREDQANLEVTIIAKDNVAPQQSSTATISVQVQDINDNNPTFDPYESAYDIPENSPPHTSICRITATDRDVGDFGEIVYSFDVQNNENALKINRSTGVISVAGEVGKESPLDREKRSSYTLFVTATDNPNNPDNQRTNQTKAITINVKDVNDEEPKFTNIDPLVKHSVLENAELGHIVFTVTAEDGDEGDNARIDYTLTAEDTLVTNLFVIQTVTKNIGGVPKYFGDIKVNEVLLGKVAEYEMNVTATDRGSVPLSVTSSLIIKVEDVNLHQPKFENPKGPRNTIQTEEEQEPGSLIFSITATDEDHGRNGEVSFIILEENDWEKFAISPNGNLTFREKLDRETKSSYEIKIQAEDDGIPNKLASTLTLIIVLLDINDKLPEFPRDSTYPSQTPPYRIYIEEEKIANDTTTNLDIAIDEDQDANSIICYFIVGGDDPVKTHFLLDKGGNLSLTTKFDRENLSNPNINMIIKATPKCHQAPEEVDINQYPPPNYGTDRTLLWVEVVITDINDNPPEFKQPILTLGVTRSTGYGTNILNLVTLITDKDATMKVEFFVNGTETHLQNQQVTGEPFVVFKNGTVKTNTYFQANMYGYFLIYVRAEEKRGEGELPFTAHATLRISLINDDQRVKVVFQEPLEEVRGFHVVFTSTLQIIIGYRIVLDKIQTHENAQGLPEVNKTDMFIHGEDLKTNETLSAAELLRLIDSYADALFNLRHTYKVLEIVPTVITVDEEDLESVFRMALILVAVLLSVLCIAICIVFYLSRQKYLRKLKAATAMAYEASRYNTPPNGLQNPYHAPVSVSENESPPPLTTLEGKVWRQSHDRELNSGESEQDKEEDTSHSTGYSDLQKLEMPGTNQHAYENTNPIYLEKIKLEESNDDPDDDSLDDNAVDQSKPGKFSEQQISMNFYTEDKNYNSVPQSKIGSGDAILSQALKQHEAQRVKNGKLQNGSVDHKIHSFDELPTTEI